MPVLNFTIPRATLYVFLTAWLVACGGNSSDNDDEVDEPEAGSIVYSGNKEVAKLTNENVAKLVSNMFTEGDASGVGSRPSPGARNRGVLTGQFAGLLRYPGQLHRRFIGELASIVESTDGWDWRPASAEIDERVECKKGFVHANGTIEKSGKGYLELTFEKCREGSEVLDGKVSVRFASFPFIGEFFDVTYRFDRLTRTSPNSSLSFGGTINFRESLPDPSAEQLTVPRLVSFNNATGDIAMIRDQIIVIKPYDDGYLIPFGMYGEIVSGRIYDSTHGYVDFWTTIPLSFRDSTQIHADGGQLHFVGNADATGRLSVLSATHARLDLDLDGDSTFEKTAVLGWTEIESSPGLADLDFDMIHDDWEVRNGLDPSDSLDALLDFDSDGATNKEEYLQGSDPQDDASLPPAVDLFTTTTTFPVDVIAGTMLTYRVLTGLIDPVEVSNVVVTIELPPEVSFQRIYTYGWNCEQESLVVTCKVGRFVDYIWGINVEVLLPEVPGVISATASVSSLTNEIDPSNNTEITLIDVVP